MKYEVSHPKQIVLSPHSLYLFLAELKKKTRYQVLFTELCTCYFYTCVATRLCVKRKQVTDDFLILLDGVRNWRNQYLHIQ